MRRAKILALVRKYYGREPAERFGLALARSIRGKIAAWRWTTSLCGAGCWPRG